MKGPIGPSQREILKLLEGRSLTYRQLADKMLVSDAAVRQSVRGLLHRRLVEEVARNPVRIALTESSGLPPPQEPQ